MSYFDIHISTMRRVQFELSSIRSELSKIQQQIFNISSRLDRCMKDSSSVDESIQNTILNLKRRQSSLEALEKSLEAILNSYQNTEENVSGKSTPAISNQGRWKPFIPISGWKIPNFFDKWRKNFKKGSCSIHNSFSTDPVNLSTGNFIYDSEDLSSGNNDFFAFRRFYNSQNDGQGSLGRDWNHNFECSLHPGEEQGHRSAVIMLEDGQEFHFIQADDGAWYTLDQTVSVLSQNDQGYIYTSAGQEKYYFDQNGKFFRKEDIAGMGYHLHYNADGTLLSAESDMGESFSFSYDSAGYLRTVTDYTGRIFSFYVSDGLLLRAVGPDQNAWTYGYTQNGLLAAVKDPKGILRVQNEYDAQGRTVRQTFADGSAMNYDYNDEEACVTVTERNGSQEKHYHDPDGHIVRIVYPDSEWNCEYDNKGNKISVKDRNDSQWHYTYDKWGNISSSVDPVGTKTSFTYGAHRQPLRISVNGTEMLKNSFDDNENLICSEDALGRMIRFKYKKRRLNCIIMQDGTELPIEYDQHGRICSIGMPMGGTINYKYDPLGRVISFTDPNGNTSCFTYDINGNIKTEVNAEGGVRSYEYDPNGNVIQITDPNGTSSKRVYNELNLPESITDEAGNTTHYSYDSMWNLSKVLTPGGAVFTYLYDKNNRLSLIRDAEGGEESFRYDENGNRILETDEEGHSIHYKYDSLGRLILVKGETSEITFAYDPFGNMISAEDALGNKVSMEYDAAGQRIKEKNNAGRELIYTYDCFGNIHSVTDNHGRKRLYRYTRGGEHLSEILYESNAKESFAYDQNGNLIRHEDAYGQVRQYEYDCMNRVKTVLQNGIVFNYLYDPMGNVVCVSDNKGGQTKYSYSPTGQLTSVCDSVGNTVEYVYDVDGNIITVKQSGELKEPPRVTSYTRDKIGRILSCTDPMGQKEEFGYNRRSDLISHLDKDGLLTKYQYTAGGSLRHIQLADGRDVFYSYDALERLSEINDWNGTTKIARNPEGSSVKVTYPDGKEAEYSYGQWGELRSAVYPDGIKQQYEYDKQYHLRKISSDGMDIQYHYDQLGRMVQKDLPGGLKVRFGYNKVGLPDTFISSDPSGEIDRFDVDYDAFGSKTSVRRFRRDMEQFSGAFSMTYDKVHRLTSVSKDGKLMREYFYDSFGNRIGKNDYSSEEKVHTEYKYNILDELETVHEKDSLLQFEYDKRGNMIRQVKNGSVFHEYTYDASNRLTAARGTEDRRVEYDYDGLGQRIGRRAYRHGRNIRNTRYLRDLTRSYDNLAIMEESSPDQSFFKKQSYLYDNGPVGMREVNSDGSISQFTYLTDDLLSPVRLMTQSGDIAQSYAYDEFGEELISGSRIQPFGFTGYIPDNISGTCFAQAREYLPQAGRFAAHDLILPYPEEPQTQNAYVYANNNPHTYVDKNGKSAVLAALAISAGIGAAAGAATNFISQEIDIHRDPTGNTQFSLTNLLADTAGGAVTGFISAIPGGTLPLLGVTLTITPTVWGVVGGVAGGAVTDIINDLGDKGKIDVGHVLEDAIINAGIGAVFVGIGKLGEKVFKNSSGKKWMDSLKKKVLGTNRSSSSILKSIEKQVSKGHKPHKLLQRFFTITAAKSIIGIVRKGIEKALGLKSPKEILKDITKNLIPWYKDPDNDKSIPDYFRDLQKGFVLNQNKSCPAAG